MCQRYALFMVYKNYMAPMFTKKQVRRPHAHVKTPAQEVGLVNRILSFGDIFGQRSLLENAQKMSEDWQYFWRAKVPKKYHRSKIYA
jgi:hypothetical protein